MILTVTLNPCIDHAMFLERLLLHDTNRVSDVARNAGGKGVNVSRVVHGLRGETLATGFLGGGAGAYVRSVLNREGVPNDFVETAGITRVNFCIDDRSGLPPTTLNEPGPEIQLCELDSLTVKVERLALEADWVVLGGSVPPNLPYDTVPELIRICRDAGAKVVLDADGEILRLGIQAGPDMVKPNTPESERLLGREIVTDEDAYQAARDIEARIRLYRRPEAPSPYVVMSRGKRGAILCHEGSILKGSSPEVEVRSTVGSGDSLVAGLLWSLECGRSIDESLAWGLAAGAATAARPGSELGNFETISPLLSHAIVSKAGELSMA